MIACCLVLEAHKVIANFSLEGRMSRLINHQSIFDLRQIPEMSTFGANLFGAFLSFWQGGGTHEGHQFLVKDLESFWVILVKKS